MRFNPKIQNKMYFNFGSQVGAKRWCIKSKKKKFGGNIFGSYTVATIWLPMLGSKCWQGKLKFTLTVWQSVTNELNITFLCRDNDIWHRNDENCKTKNLVIIEHKKNDPKVVLNSPYYEEKLSQTWKEFYHSFRFERLCAPLSLLWCGQAFGFRMLCSLRCSTHLHVAWLEGSRPIVVSFSVEEELLRPLHLLHRSEEKK